MIPVSKKMFVCPFTLQLLQRTITCSLLFLSSNYQTHNRKLYCPHFFGPYVLASGLSFTHCHLLQFLQLYSLLGTFSGGNSRTTRKYSNFPSAKISSPSLNLFFMKKNSTCISCAFSESKGILP